MSSNGDNRRDIIAKVFKGVDNRMRSGYERRENTLSRVQVGSATL